MDLEFGGDRARKLGSVKHSVEGLSGSINEKVVLEIFGSNSTLKFIIWGEIQGLLQK